MSTRTLRFSWVLIPVLLSVAAIVVVGWGLGGTAAQGSTLTVTKTADTDDGTSEDHLPPVPNASFTASVTSGDALLVVNFRDTSSGGTATSWLWNFGDGTTSTDQNPTHTFNKGGLFTVELTATNAAGSDTATRYGLITVTGLVSKIAFESNRDGHKTIYVMDDDGSNKTRLTKTFYNEFPAWSPDGRKIAFTSSKDGNADIYVINTDGSGLIRLTNNASQDEHPDWSPDGKRIAFHSRRDGNDEIYVMNSDGTGETRLTNNAMVDSEAAWSPDGTKLAFASTRDGNVEIYFMNADGTQQTRITNNSPSLDRGPDWSPTGEWIVFTYNLNDNRNDNVEVYAMKVDGTDRRNLSNNKQYDSGPSWGPSGALIVFQRDVSYTISNNVEIYIMDRDGSNQKRLTNTPDPLPNSPSFPTDANPTWSPAVFPQVPGSLQNTSVSTDATPTFAWTATPSTTGYQVRLDSTGEWASVGNVTTYTVPDTGVLSSGVLSSGDHTFQVRAVAVTGFAGSPASLAFTFKVNDGEADSGASTVTVSVNQRAPVTVAGTVRLEAMPHPISGARITVFRDGVVQRVTSDPESGGFEVVLAPGTYDVTVEKDGFLRATRVGLVVDADMVLPDARLLSGELNGDGVIDLRDLAVPAGNQGRQESPWE